MGFALHPCCHVSHDLYRMSSLCLGDGRTCCGLSDQLARTWSRCVPICRGRGASLPYLFRSVAQRCQAHLVLASVSDEQVTVTLSEGAASFFLPMPGFLRNLDSASSHNFSPSASRDPICFLLGYTKCFELFYWGYYGRHSSCSQCDLESWLYLCWGSLQPFAFSTEIGNDFILFLSNRKVDN